MTFIFILNVIFLAAISNAAVDFSISPATLSLTSATSGSDSATFSITSNIANLNLTLTDSNLVNGANTVALTLNQTTITNMNSGSSKSILASISTAGTTVGTFTGNITIVNADNTSDNTTIPVSLTVASTTVDGASLIIVDCDGSDLDFEMEINVDDNSENFRFCLKNNGNIALRNIEIDLPSSFDGDNDNIDDNDFQINGEDGDNTFSLNDDFNNGNPYILLPGQISDTIRFSLDIPSNLDPDTYDGRVDFSADNASGSSVFNEDYTFKIFAYSDNEDVFMQYRSLYVKDGVLEVRGEPGEYVNDYDITVENNAGYDVTDLYLELDGDLQEENSNNKILESFVTFSPSNFDLDRSDEDDIEVRVDIPEDQPVGTYTGTVKLYNSAGRELGDDITIKVKVVGDIYIDSIDFSSETVKPGENLDVTVKVANSGSQIQRSIKVLATLYDIEAGNGDIHESSSTFLLESNSNREEIIRFNIPTEATDGSHTLEIRLQYGSEELIEVKSVEVVRPAHKIEIQSSAINPSVIKCDDKLYTYIKFQNLGKYDEDVKVRTEIVGKGIFEETNKIDLGTDDIMQKNLVLDISKLEAGTYTVQQKIIYSGTLFVKKEDTLKVLNCTDSTVGVVIKETNTTISTNQSAIINQTSDKTISLFGEDYEKNTVYLASGVGVVFVLIIISLFLL